MKCNESDGAILDYLDGILPEQDRVLLERHIAICHDCAQELASYKSLDQMLSMRFQPPALPPGFESRMHSRSDRQGIGVNPRWLPWLDLAGYASVAAVLPVVIRVVLEEFNVTLSVPDVTLALLAASVAAVAWGALNLAVGHSHP
jgi:anti-sigma factor RsiW